MMRKRVQNMAFTGLRLSGVGKKYGSRTVLQDIGFELENGSIMQVKGRNGSGKSTLLQIAAGVSSPTAGERVISTVPEKRIITGYAPERFPRLRFSPEEYLLLMGRMRGMDAGLLKERIHQLAERLALPLKKKRVDILSKGTAQKVNLVQAFLQPPDLLVLDEPFSGLDTGAQETLIRLMDECRELGAIILLTCHEETGAEGLVDRILLLQEGMIVADRTSGADADDGINAMPGLKASGTGSDKTVTSIASDPIEEAGRMVVRFRKKAGPGNETDFDWPAERSGIYSVSQDGETVTVLVSRASCDSAIAAILRHGGSVLQVIQAAESERSEKPPL
ncbi:ATP-binding cassette domain-containing protein [Gorillibacterium massiliense]|uniref:ATP-binding cassette domain-containing protein n=1 Tax=Gorillibacterium massiliense TaxID=1280390 RepID=UPI0004AF0BBF|nr:ABC transporter ATP-binding protein [Gorillibacterium massiliense]